MERKPRAETTIALSLADSATFLLVRSTQSSADRKGMITIHNCSSDFILIHLRAFVAP